jgi:RsiW-degrading membrane proteinase PrsW (M82 family)
VNVAFIVGIAFAPALFWFWFFARRDRNPEPAQLLLRTFAWGAVMVLPAAILEVSLEGVIGTLAFFMVGPIEELAKFVAARNIARNKAFDEPVDGLIYATAAALGFATLENVLYMIQFGADVILVRGPLSTLGHILFAMPWGYAMAYKRFRGGRWVLRRGLALGAVLHGLFNLFLMAGGTEGLEWLLLPFVPLMIVMWRLSNRYYAHARANLEPHDKPGVAALETKPAIAKQAVTDQALEEQA